MEEQEKYVTCPCCDGEIRGIKQFPLTQITSFEYIPLPNLIKGFVEESLSLQLISGRLRKRVIQNPQIPEEVMQRLSQSDEFSYQGRIYRRVNFVANYHREYTKEDFFECNPNATQEDFERSLGSREFEPGIRIYTDLTEDVKIFLSEKERALKTLKESVGKTLQTKDIFNLFDISDKYHPTNLREFSFNIRERNLGECVLEVDSAREEADIHFGYGPEVYVAGFSLSVAKFTYDGLFRER